MSAKKRGLGRGLDSLLSSATAPAEESGDVLRELALDHLQPGKHQPRRQFDEEALEALAASIRAQGIVQPLVVRAVGADRYEIVAGERRWRAARMAQLTHVPVVIRTMDDRAAMAVALVENIQRADLNPLEQAEALHKLIGECALTHEQVAEAIGCSRAQVTNLLRLTELNADVQTLVRAGRLSLGHAKVLLGAQGARQSSLARMAAERALSVRQTEALLKSDAAAAQPKDAGTARKQDDQLARRLGQRLGLPVKLQQREPGRGRLTVIFRSEAELAQLMKIFDTD